jgi:hypothetical protein
MKTQYPPDKNDGPRSPDGRYQPGTSGNPKGRPRKPTANNLLVQILDEDIPNQPAGQKSMSIREALVRSTALRALKDARIAILILNLDEAARAAAQNAQPQEGMTDDESEILLRYMEREFRRRLQKDAETPPQVPEDNDDNVL